MGALQYLIMTHPDIAYVVSVVSQFMHAPGTTYLYYVKCILRYLQGIVEYGLFLCASSSISMVVAYCDIDWVGCPDNRHSFTKFVVPFGF